MDRVRAARGGQAPTASTTRLIRPYSRINAYYATRLGLRSRTEGAEVLGGPYLDARLAAGPSID